MTTRQSRVLTRNKARATHTGWTPWAITLIAIVTGLLLVAKVQHDADGRKAFAAYAATHCEQVGRSANGQFVTWYEC